MSRNAILQTHAKHQPDGFIKVLQAEKKVARNSFRKKGLHRKINILVWTKEVVFFFFSDVTGESKLHRHLDITVGKVKTWNNEKEKRRLRTLMKTVFTHGQTQRMEKNVNANFAIWYVRGDQMSSVRCWKNIEYQD